MSIAIDQEPKYKLVPAGQEHIVWSVFDAAVIGGSKHKIKYIASVYVSNVKAGLVDIANRVAVLKVNPNAVGSGIFDISTIIGNYVSPDYEGGYVYNTGAGLVNFSEYKGVDYNIKSPHSIHTIDKFSSNRNSVRYCQIKFEIEFSDTATGVVNVESYNTLSEVMIVFNGVLYDTDIMLQSSSTGDFGYQMTQEGIFPYNTNSKFLSNAPAIQYIREDDYMTVPFFSSLPATETGVWTDLAPSGTLHSVKRLCFQYYYNGSTTGGQINWDITTGAGGNYGELEDSNVKIQYFGIGTANQANVGTSIPANWDYYQVWLQDDLTNRITQHYYFYKKEDSCKGYETIRLTWLNKYGTWDYYNFTQKNMRTLRTERKAYKQVSGSWNKTLFQLNGHTGGMKNYSTSIKESITLNTDYLTEEEAAWLEELFISNDVYMLEQNSDDTTTGYIRKYITPVRITSEEMIRKTTANDKLKQYTFEIETNRTKKSHKI